MHRRRGDGGERGGFTLIEVMAAMVVFTGGVLMVLSLAETLGEQMRRSGLVTELSAVVREQVDSLSALGYGGLTVGQTSTMLTLRPNRNWTLTRTVTDYSQLVRQITVTLEPTGFTGPSRSYSTWVADEW